MQTSNASNRLDRLPISRYHKITLVGVAFAYFFEFADINTFAVTAPKLVKIWGVTINQIAYVTSLSFVGMFFGSIIGGCHRRPVGSQERAHRHHPVVRAVLLRHGVLPGHRPARRPAGPHLRRAVRDDRGRRHLRQRDLPGRGPRQVPGLRHRHRHLRYPGHQPDRQPRRPALRLVLAAGLPVGQPRRVVPAVRPVPDRIPPLV